MNPDDPSRYNPSALTGPRPLRQSSPRASVIPSPTSRRTSGLRPDSANPTAQFPQNSFMMAQHHNQGSNSEDSAPITQFAEDNPSDSDSWTNDEPRSKALYEKSGPNQLPSGARQRDSWKSSRNYTRRESKRGYMDDFQEYDAELEDELHNVEDDEDDDIVMRSGLKKKTSRRRCGVFSIRGILNLGALLLLTLGLVTVFAVLPVLTYFRAHAFKTQLSVNSGGYNLGGINGSGQVPVINNLRGLIDPTTPSDVMSRQGFNGQQYNLVFSDEFTEDGRTFWPGDDPYWEAVNLHYWATGEVFFELRYHVYAAHKGTVFALPFR